MRVAIVGLGVQGRKRAAVAGGDVVATVDPAVPAAQYGRIEQVPLEEFDAAIISTPDAPKIGLMQYLLGHGKHALVEKPLTSRDPQAFSELEAICHRTGAVAYTAYNHRFEPHLASVKDLLARNAIGRVYQARMFYGNGTARDVRNSPWRDQGLGVIADLASHLLDLALFFFGPVAGGAELWAHERFENQACDYFLLGFPKTRPMLRLEGTLLSWRNSFFVDIVGEHGSVHVAGLCKWGPASLTVRTRKLPSGRPDEEVRTLEQADPTWALEYAYFRELCRNGHCTTLGRDVWINSVLHRIAVQAGVAVFPVDSKV